MRITERLTSFYWLLLPQFIAETLWYADWKRAKKRGLLFVIWELALCMLSINAHALFIENSEGVSGSQVHQFLSGYGIPTWGWSYIDDGMRFHVRSRQADKAQRLLLGAGVIVQ